MSPVNHSIPRCYRTADRHVDHKPDDGLVQTPDGRVMTSTEAHELNKRRARRDKRSDKATGNQHARRAVRRDTKRLVRGDFEP